MNETRLLAKTVVEIVLIVTENNTWHQGYVMSSLDYVVLGREKCSTNICTNLKLENLLFILTSLPLPPSPPSVMRMWGGMGGGYSSLQGQRALLTSLKASDTVCMSVLLPELFTSQKTKSIPSTV
jgi:hypothetical protein